MKCRDCKNIGFGFEQHEPGERANLFFGWCRKINDSPDLHMERECEYFVHFSESFFHFLENAEHEKEVIDMPPEGKEVVSE